MEGKTKAPLSGIARKRLFFALVACVFTGIFVLTCITPMLSDDFTYSMLRSPLEAFQKEYEQYMTWGGRSVVHLILRLTMLMPKPVFNVLNALVFVFMSLLVYRVAAYSPRGEESCNVLLYLFISACFWLYIPAFGQTVLWWTGSLNYLWGSTIILSFVYVYHAAVERGHRFAHPAAAAALVFLLGVLAGWSNENSSGGGILLAVFYMLLARLYKKPLPVWLWSGLAGALCGFALMMLSPGNRARAALLGSDLPFWGLAAERVRWVQESIARLFPVLLVLFAALFAITLLYGRSILKCLVPLAFFLAAAATAYVLVLSPLQANRAQMGTALFLIVATARLLAGLPRGFPLAKAAMGCTSCVLAVLALAAVPNAFMDTLYAYSISQEQVRYIYRQKEQGNVKIVVPLLPEAQDPHNPAKETAVLETSALAWVNESMARYYGVESLRGVGRQEWKLRYENASPRLMGCYDLAAYATLLHEGNYSVVLTLGCAAPGAVPEWLEPFWRALGLGGLQGPEGGWDLVAQWQNGRLVFRQMEEDVVDFSGAIGALPFQAVANRRDGALPAQILVNGIEYSQSSPWLNVVVVDLDQMRVVDSFAAVPGADDVEMAR